MTRLRYWLTAKTIYSVHSPFVFDLCRQVLFTRPRRLRRHSWAQWRYDDLCYKLSDYLGLRNVTVSEGETLFAGPDTLGRVLVVSRPHRNRAAESRWTQLCQSSDYRVSIDLYDVGILFSNPHLHPQRFLLR